MMLNEYNKYLLLCLLNNYILFYIFRMYIQNLFFEVQILLVTIALTIY